jgi:F-type H+-transporting ATPase subunit gamma
MATRDYAEKAFEMLHNVAANANEQAHPLLTIREEIRNSAVVLVTSDRGLCGSYNANIVSLAERFIKALPTPAEVVTVGRKGRDLMVRRGYNVVADFDAIGDNPGILEVTPVAQVVVDDFLSGKVDQVFVAYTDFVNLVTRIPHIKQLLPLRPRDFEGMAVADYVESVDLTGVGERSYIYEPSLNDLLDIIVPRFTDLQLFQAVLESQASEHSARMVAMNNATDNAAVLVEELTLLRNRARQTAITNEMLDIAGGAEALSSNDQGGALGEARMERAISA